MDIAYKLGSIRNSICVLTLNGKCDYYPMNKPEIYNSTKFNYSPVFHIPTEWKIHQSGISFDQRRVRDNERIPSPGLYYMNNCTTNEHKRHI